MTTVGGLKAGGLLRGTAWGALAAAIAMLAMPSATLAQDRGERARNYSVEGNSQLRSERRAARVERQGNRSAARVERGGDRRAAQVQRSGDRRAQAAASQGNYQRAQRIEQRANRNAGMIDRSSERQAARIDRRSEARADAIRNGNRGDYRNRAYQQAERNRAYRQADRNTTYRDQRQYRDQREYRDGDRYRDGSLYRDGSRYREGRQYRDQRAYRDQRYRDGNRYRNGYNNGYREARRDYRRWNRTWRDNSRYDWYRYRSNNRSLYSIGRYYAPYRNYSYRRLGIGFSLGSLFYSNRYWISDPWRYRLPEVYGPYRWVRYYDDVMLVDIYTGEVVDVIYDFFW